MIEAEAGLMHITGEPTSAPVKVGVAITDLTTGLYVHGAIMAALISRSQTGNGVWIDCSLLEAQVSSSFLTCRLYQKVNHDLYGKDRVPGEYCVKLFDRWSRSHETRNSSSFVSFTHAS
jgi:crotonobetainyl-CoA:carnitine CoA-transferase CaiB-like acyl-CoA transferase